MKKQYHKDFPITNSLVCEHAKCQRTAYLRDFMRRSQDGYMGDLLAPVTLCPAHSYNRTPWLRNQPVVIHRICEYGNCQCTAVKDYPVRDLGWQETKIVSLCERHKKQIEKHPTKIIDYINVV